MTNPPATVCAKDWRHSSDSAKTGGRSCKRRFSQVQSQIITFHRKSHYNIFNTEAREAKGLLKDCHGPLTVPRRSSKRNSVMNWSNRVYHTALVRNICCPFAFLATLSLPRCRRKLYDTASCRHVGGRAPPTPEASASLPVDNVR